MLERVTNASVYEKIYSQISKLQQGMIKTQETISSGMKTNSIQELSNQGKLNTVLDLQSKLKNCDTYSDTNQMVIDRLEYIDLALSGIIDIVTKVKVDLTTRNNVNKFNYIGQNAQYYLAGIKNLLNSSLSERYLFGGSKTNIEPVGDIVNNSNVINNISTANYYQGNNVILSVSANEQQNISYGITADNKGFSEIIGAIHNIITAEKAKDEDLFKQAFEEVTSSMNNLIELRSQNGNVLKTLQDANKHNQDLDVYIKKALAPILITDIPEASMAYTYNQSTLMAAYSALARMSKISLADYLK